MRSPPRAARRRARKCPTTGVAPRRVTMNVKRRRYAERARPGGSGRGTTTKERDHATTSTSDRRATGRGFGRSARAPTFQRSDRPGSKPLKKNNPQKNLLSACIIGECGWRERSAAPSGECGVPMKSPPLSGGLVLVRSKAASVASGHTPL